MEKLIKSDNVFLQSKLITNADNIFIQLHFGIATNNLDKVDHFINDKVFSDFRLKLDSLNAKNQVQIYDQISIKQTTILKIEELDEKYITKINITSEYISYIIDRESKVRISGDPDTLIEKENYLTFEKSKEAIKQGDARKCHSCGANININASGECEYCGTIYDLEKHDWILTDLKTL